MAHPDAHEINTELLPITQRSSEEIPLMSPLNPDLRHSRKYECAALSLVLSSLTALVLVLILKLSPKHQLLVLISLDGTRPEYLDRGLTPTLSKLILNGFRLNLEPVFPSVTFPNHVTLTSGLFPESHQIVANTFFDPVYNESFSYTSAENNADPKWWNSSEPLWITAEKNGLISATCFWPGSEAPHDGVRPTYWLQYEDFSPSQQIDTVLGWLDQKPRPNVITIYFHHIDSAGHQAGPNSLLVNES